MFLGGTGMQYWKEWIELTSIQPTFFCSKLTIETLGQGVKYIQS